MILPHAGQRANGQAVILTVTTAAGTLLAFLGHKVSTALQWLSHAAGKVQADKTTLAILRTHSEEFLHAYQE